MQTHHSEMRPSVRNESDNLTLTRRYFFWYTVGIALCGFVSGANFPFVYATLKALLKAAGVLS